MCVIKRVSNELISYAMAYRMEKDVLVKITEWGEGAIFYRN